MIETECKGTLPCSLVLFISVSKTVDGDLFWCLCDCDFCYQIQGNVWGGKPVHVFVFQKGNQKDACSNPEDDVRLFC